MAYYPQNATGLNYITYPAGPVPGSATVVTAGSANTKGSYAQITASSGFTCNLVSLQVYGGITTSGLQYLIDLATGAGGAEVVKIPDVLSATQGITSSVQKGGLRQFPLAIASGTRIAARCACSTGSANMRLGVSLVAAGGVAGISTFVAYGVNTADSGGTAIDPGGVADTKGSYVQITASTSDVIQWLAFQNTLGGNTAPQTNSWYQDLATGAGGAEVVLIPDIPAFVESGNAANLPKMQPFLTYIAASTRIAVRASSNLTDATDRLIDVALITGTAPAETAGAGGAWAYA